jgi:hypothetical protein
VNRKEMILLDKQQDKEIETKAGEEELFDKMYFMDVTSMNKVMGKTSILSFLGVSLIGIMFSGVEWWVKGLFGLGSFLVFSFAYYDMKYFMGLRKNPFMLFPNRKVFRYFNEFEGNKEIDIMQIKEIKVYTRGKETFLWEIFLHNQKKEENVNVSGFDAQTLQEMMEDLKKINPNFAVTSNHDPKKKRG